MTTYSKLGEKPGNKGLNPLIPNNNNYTTPDIFSGRNVNNQSKHSKSSMVARSVIPDSHRRAADGYMVLIKVFGRPVVPSKLMEKERRLLAKYDFNLLEFTTFKQAEEEIALLKEWSASTNKHLKWDADNLIEIRGKELKHLIATNYVAITDEIYSGYRFIERYFEEISKY